LSVSGALPAIDAARLAPGFDNPVHDAQATFRAILDAMAHPGRPVELPGRFTPPVPLGAAMAAAALTLCDADTPLWLDATLAGCADFLRFHCGAALAAPGIAHFALIGAPDAMPSLETFALGSDEYPDRSATLIVEVERLRAGHGLTLSGPGVAGTALLDVARLPKRFWAERHLLAELFPRGLDLILTCGSRLAALPRTTRVGT
jgi:alpha-D-ribose 1-methylphosphonate 5-triphosphate synthase subunit PhnH